MFLTLITLRKESLGNGCRLFSFGERLNLLALWKWVIVCGLQIHAPDFCVSAGRGLGSWRRA